MLSWYLQPFVKKHHFINVKIFFCFREDHHKKTITRSEPFIRLLDAIQGLVYDLSAKDLINFLILCRRLNLPYKIEPFVKAVEKLQNDHTDLSFYELCLLWNVLPEYMNKSKNLKNSIKIKLIEEISHGSHVESPDNLIGALIFLSNRSIKAKSWEFSDVLKGVLGKEKNFKI